jgi:AcrR family transcriptional regulator
MVAERAGLTSAAVFHHFGGKRELFLAVYEETERAVFTLYRQALASEETFVGKVVALLEASHQIFCDDPEMASFVAIAGLEARRHPELAEVKADQQWNLLTREIVAHGVSTGELAEEDAYAVRGLLAAMVNGLSQMAAQVSVQAHRQFINGYQRLFQGTLVKPLRRRARRPAG